MPWTPGHNPHTLKPTLTRLRHKTRTALYSLTHPALSANYQRTNTPTMVSSTSTAYKMYSKNGDGDSTTYPTDPLPGR
ncbi:hypothetical protein CGRA01v4_06813 [Colletotrichum graminicola]|nr:hypothetical protein CGRA01v4_06813 [Colletotrichum graminicola]